MKNKQILSKNAENLGCRYRDQNQDDLLTAQGTFSPAGPLRPWKTKRMHKVHSKKCRCVYQCYFGAGLLLLHLSNHHKLHVGLIQCRSDHQLFKRLITRLPGENFCPDRQENEKLQSQLCKYLGYSVQLTTFNQVFKCDRSKPDKKQIYEALISYNILVGKLKCPSFLISK